MTDMLNFKMGDDVQTRCGWPARIVCDDFKSENNHSLVAVITDRGIDWVKIYYANGRRNLELATTLDLIPKPSMRKTQITFCHDRLRDDALALFGVPSTSVEAGTEFTAEITLHPDGRLEIERIKP